MKSSDYMEFSVCPVLLKMREGSIVSDSHFFLTFSPRVFMSCRWECSISMSIKVNRTLVMGRKEKPQEELQKDGSLSPGTVRPAVGVECRDSEGLRRKKSNHWWWLEKPRRRGVCPMDPGEVIPGSAGMEVTATPDWMEPNLWEREGAIQQFLV